MQIFENNLSLFRSPLSFSLSDHPISHSDLPPPPVSFPITSPFPGAISLIVYHSQFFNPPPCDHTSPVTSHLVSLTFVSVYLFTCLPTNTYLLSQRGCEPVTTFIRLPRARELVPTYSSQDLGPRLSLVSRIWTWDLSHQSLAHYQLCKLDCDGDLWKIRLFIFLQTLVPPPPGATEQGLPGRGTHVNEVSSPKRN